MKKKVYMLIAALLVLSVPWLFMDWSETSLLGLPLWAAYSLIYMACFAVIMVILIEKFWTDFSE